jgi:hypothetical protein
MRLFPTTSVPLAGLVSFATLVGLAANGFADQQITPMVAHAWCCERHPSQGNTPDLAIVGDITTFTWSTLSYTTNAEDEHSLGLDFGQPTPLYRIRLWKEKDGGGGENVKNLAIEYTANDPSLPLNKRGGWTAVTNMVTGFNGETLNVDTASGGSVNPGGTVMLDVHDSPSGDGWASLTFDPVMATAVRIVFANPDIITFNHYKVYEFEAYSP